MRKEVLKRKFQLFNLYFIKWASDRIGIHTGLRNQVLGVRLSPCPQEIIMKKGIALYEALLVMIILGLFVSFGLMIITAEKKEIKIMGISKL